MGVGILILVVCYVFVGLFDGVDFLFGLMVCLVVICLLGSGFVVLFVGLTGLFVCN